MVVVATVRVNAKLVQLERTRLLQEHLKVSACPVTPIAQQERNQLQVLRVVPLPMRVVNPAPQENIKPMQDQQRVRHVTINFARVRKFCWAVKEVVQVNARHVQHVSQVKVALVVLLQTWEHVTRVLLENIPTPMITNSVGNVLEKVKAVHSLFQEMCGVMDVEGTLLAPANIVVDVRRVSTQSIVVCLQDKELAKNALVARQVSIVQIAETKVVVFLKLEFVIRVLGVARVSIELGAQMALLEVAPTVQTANTRVLLDQKPVHHVLRFLHRRVNTSI